MKRFIMLLPLLLGRLAAFADAPQYWVSAGTAVNVTGDVKPYAWTAIGMRLGETSNYAFFSIDMTRAESSARTGFGRLLASSGRFHLIGIGDAGAGAAEGEWRFAFSGGFALGITIRGDTHASLGIRLLRVQGEKTAPVVGVGIGRTF